MRASVVVPAYNEGEGIVGVLDRLLAAVQSACEVLVVFDRADDTTAPYARQYADRDGRVVPLLNTYGPGPANAIRFGVDHAANDVVVVTMADGSDQPEKIDELIKLVEDGAVIGAASRYMRGGRQIGGPFLKGLLSRVAGISLSLLAHVGTHDATNSFKAYSKEFLDAVGIESSRGFTMAIELVAKARRLRLPIAEVPATWVDRTEGKSNFKLTRWLPEYLRWYLFAFGSSLRSEQLKSHRKTRPSL